MFYPLLLKPPVKDYLWGGTRLKTEYNYETDKEKAAEAWVLSCHKDGSDIVENGELAGKTLPEVLELWGDKAIGKNAAAFPYFPLLIKLIDAKDRLSVQVHPDDTYALKNEGEFGKTEMWYVVDCDEGAELIYGFNREVSKEEFECRIKNNTLPAICNYVPAHKGDVFFIAAGTLHAIGAGILIAEVQQNSNTTYRVFDYGRLGADGKPRALHVEKALDVARLCPPERSAGPIGKPEQNGDCTSTLLAKCGYFTARLLDVAGSAPLCADGESFHSLLCLSGSGAVICGGGAVPFAKGDSLFLPAGLGAYTIAGRAQLVLTTL